LGKVPAKAAIERAKSLFPDGKEFMLEEIDRKPGGNWLITIGFDVPGRATNPFVAVALPSRVYKQFELSADGKEVIRMMIRHVP
jgi:hypothetical protein